MSEAANETSAPDAWELVDTRLQQAEGICAAIAERSDVPTFVARSAWAAMDLLREAYEAHQTLHKAIRPRATTEATHA